MQTHYIQYWYRCSIYSLIIHNRFLHTYIHIHACTYIYMYVCMYVCMYVTNDNATIALTEGCEHWREMQVFESWLVHGLLRIEQEGVVSMYHCRYVCMYVCMYVRMYVPWRGTAIPAAATYSKARRGTAPRNCSARATDRGTLHSNGKLCVNVCMYACMYVFMYAWKCLCKRSWMHSYRSTCQSSSPSYQDRRTFQSPCIYFKTLACRIVVHRRYYIYYHPHLPKTSNSTTMVKYGLDESLTW